MACLEPPTPGEIVPNSRPMMDTMGTPGVREACEAWPPIKTKQTKRKPMRESLTHFPPLLWPRLGAGAREELPQWTDILCSIPRDSGAPFPKPLSHEIRQPLLLPGTLEKRHSLVFSRNSLLFLPLHGEETQAAKRPIARGLVETFSAVLSLPLLWR